MMSNRQRKNQYTTAYRGGKYYANEFKSGRTARQIGQAESLEQLLERAADALLREHGFDKKGGERKKAR